MEAAPPWARLRAARDDYRRLLTEKMRAPDGGYEEGFTVPGSGASPRRTAERAAGNLEMNNPLSLHDEVRPSFGDRALWGELRDEMSCCRTRGGSGSLPWNCGRRSCKMWSGRECSVHCVHAPAHYFRTRCTTRVRSF